MERGDSTIGRRPASALLREQGLHFANQHGHVLLDDVPDGLVAQFLVLMHDRVAEGDDAACAGDSRGDLCVGALQPRDRFADDRELSLDLVALPDVGPKIR